MNSEHEPELTDKTDADPSINPKVLIEQEGPNKGTIAPIETGQGLMQLYETQEDGTKIPNGEMTARTIEGLPVIGADAEEAQREKEFHPDMQNMKDFKERSKDSSDALFGKVPEGTKPEQMTDILNDQAGTEAMAQEVKDRAKGVAKDKFPLASQDVIDRFGQKAYETFKKEVESKTAERKATHEQGVEDMIAALDAPDAQLPAELMPKGPETPEEPDDRPAVAETAFR